MTKPHRQQITHIGSSWLIKTAEKCSGFGLVVETIKLTGGTVGFHFIVGNCGKALTIH